MAKKRFSSEEAPSESAPAEMAEAPAIGFDKEAKIKAIMDSQMPDAQKEAAIRALSPATKAEGVPLSVYAKIRKIDPARLKALSAYPKAKGVRLASLQQWDEIFKGF